MNIGYARISTRDQTLDLQLDARAKTDCDKVFTKTASGAGGPANALPVADLLGWPALFPFGLSFGADEIRRRSGFHVQREGGNVDMVRAEH